MAAKDPTIINVTGVDSKYRFCQRHHVFGTKRKTSLAKFNPAQARSR
ncbi:hypothetical protein [Novosphingobium sp. 32-60-15]